MSDTEVNHVLDIFPRSNFISVEDYFPTKSIWICIKPVFLENRSVIPVDTYCQVKYFHEKSPFYFVVIEFLSTDDKVLSVKLLPEQMSDHFEQVILESFKPTDKSDDEKEPDFLIPVANLCRKGVSPSIVNCFACVYLDHCTHPDKRY